MSVRSWLKDSLTVPAAWTWITDQRVPDVINKTTVVTKHTRIEPLDEGSVGQLRHSVILSVFSALTKNAEDDLDDAVATMLTKLDGNDLIRFVSAEKVVAPNQQNYGWDLTLTVITNPKPEEA